MGVASVREPFAALHPQRALPMVGHRSRPCLYALAGRVTAEFAARALNSGAVARLRRYGVWHRIRATPAFVPPAPQPGHVAHRYRVAGERPHRSARRSHARGRLFWSRPARVPRHSWYGVLHRGVLYFTHPTGPAHNARVLPILASTRARRPRSRMR